MSLGRIQNRLESVLLVMLFGVSILVSATLLFWIQPVFTKMVIPVLGGAPSTWNVAMVCFQTLLLAGYLYADRLTSLNSARMQGVIHAVLIIGISAWVICAPEREISSQYAYRTPVSWLIYTLISSVGVVFFTLSTTSTLLQRWYASLRPNDDVYWLYIVSNIGSMLGVFGYIALIEPVFGLSIQAVFFKWGFISLAILLLITSWVFGRRVGDKPGSGRPALIAWQQRLYWIILSAVPSGLLLGTTTHITTEISPVPLLWLLLLGLYLISFMVAFARWKRLTPPFLLKIQATLCIPLLADFFLDVVAGGGVGMALWHMSAFFVTATVCHRLLYEARPESTQLTTFYLYIAIGGVVGSLFVSLLSPLLFSSYFEYPLMFAIALALRPAGTSISETWKKDILTGIAVLAALATFLYLLQPLLHPYNDLATAPLLIAGFFTIKFCFDQELRPLRLACCFAAAIVAGIILSDLRGKVVEQERNFYGVITINGDHPEVFSMYHGTTVHGMQYLDSSRYLTPLTYYHPSGPLGDFMTSWREMPITASSRVAAIGLGVGSAACYGRPYDKFTFFEINPAVIALAKDKRYFSYLSSCLPAIEIIEGDARISLEHETRQFDLIILDAFTSDAIPVHLITKQAFAVYWSQLRPGGIIITHISNRFLSLAPVLKKIADDRGMALKIFADEDISQDPFKQASVWVIMGDSAAVESLRLSSRWADIPSDSGATLWTDDFSNILSVMRLF